MGLVREDHQHPFGRVTEYRLGENDGVARVVQDVDKGTMKMNRPYLDTPCEMSLYFAAKDEFFALAGEWEKDMGKDARDVLATH